MYSFFKYIYNTFTEYKNLYDFYMCNFSNDLTYFSFVNSLVLLLILLIVFVRFCILRYTFKKFIKFLAKRLFFAFFIFLVVYLSSSFSVCDIAEKTNINNILNSDTKKYACIAAFTITGCYLGYQYIPTWYNSVLNYTKYKKYLIIKKQHDKYTVDYNIYLEKLKLKKTLNLEIENFKTTTSNFNTIINNFIKNFNNVSQQTDLFKNSAEISTTNIFLHNFKVSKGLSKDYLNEYSWRINYLTDNFEKIGLIATELYTTESIKNIPNKEEILTLQIKYFESIKDLYNFYALVLVPFACKHMDNNGNWKNPKDSSNFMFNIQLNHLYTEADKFTQNTLDLSIKVLEKYKFIENLPTIINPETLEGSANVLEFSSLVKPRKLKMPDEFKNFNFSENNLEGIKFISINFGYIFFYPVLYCSNKILGTANPLSEKLFKEAVFYFFTGWF